jgi:hypothetical protein
MNRSRNERGQFVPISAMVMFTIVVFMVAVVNIYKVAKTKLKVQNLADAVAMNITIQMASGINAVADRNEWPNNLYGTDNETSKKLRQLPPGAPCPEVDPDKELPPISCAEYATYTRTGRKDYRGKPFSFASVEDVAGKNGTVGGYGRLIKTINDAQKIFVQSYNTFIGATPGVGQRALGEVLRDNIPELRNDPALKVVIWNSFRRESDAKARKEKLEIEAKEERPSSTAAIEPLMDEMKFKIHDMYVAYDQKTMLGGRIYASVKTTLGALVNNGQPVGWMEVDTSSNGMPIMKIRGQGGQQKTRIGAGAYVVKKVDLMGIPVAVSAKATAYLVPGSGKMPMTDGSGGGQAASERPEFKPTYWVKLGDQ